MLTRQLLYYRANKLLISVILYLSTLQFERTENSASTISIKVVIILSDAAVDIETQPSRSAPPVFIRWLTSRTTNQTYGMPHACVFERETSQRVANEIATWTLVPENVTFLRHIVPPSLSAQGNACVLRALCWSSYLTNYSTQIQDSKFVETFTQTPNHTKTQRRSCTLFKTRISHRIAALHAGAVRPTSNHNKTSRSYVAWVKKHQHFFFLMLLLISWHIMVV